MKAAPSVRSLAIAAVCAALFASTALAETLPAFKLTAKDGVFDAAVIEVPAGKRFTLEVTIAGKSAIEFESKELRQEKVVAPGKKVTLTINALKAGEYKFVDEFHEATAQGKIVAK
jgi:plastocyanin